VLNITLMAPIILTLDLRFLETLCTPGSSDSQTSGRYSSLLYFLTENERTCQGVQREINSGSNCGIGTVGDKNSEVVNSLLLYEAL